MLIIRQASDRMRYCRAAPVSRVLEQGTDGVIADASVNMIRQAGVWRKIWLSQPCGNLNRDRYKIIVDRVRTGTRAESEGRRSPISRQSGHLIRGKAATDSEGDHPVGRFCAEDYMTKCMGLRPRTMGISLLLTGTVPQLFVGKFLWVDESHDVAADVEFELRRSA